MNRVTLGREFETVPLAQGVPLPGGALFIDVPNVLMRHGGPVRVNWRILAATILENEFKETQLVHAGAYSRSGSEGEAASRWLDDALYRRAQGHEPRSARQRNSINYGHLDRAIRRDGKDIDSWIMNDIWMSTTKYHMAEVMAHEKPNYPFHMKYVLVSGDGGYLRTLRQLERAFCGFMDRPSIVVYGWREKIHSRLWEFVGEKNIRLLDEIPGVPIVATPSAARAAE